MGDLKVVLVGAGSRSFGPRTIDDILLSKPLGGRKVEVVLMDIVGKHLVDIEEYARAAMRKVGRKLVLSSTTSLDRALRGADFVVSAIEVDRYLYWAMDFHVPRRYGFAQVYGENGGPGGMFHALRNMAPTIHIARRMEAICPNALLLNYTNPETKLCEAVSRLTSIRAYGLCHGIGMGLALASEMLEKPREEIEYAACGINHFTWFQVLRDRKTGADLYPLLWRIDAAGDPLANWHEMGLARILFRRFGLWPSPSPNHYGEYLSWAEEFVAHQVQYYYDPMKGHPWATGKIPEFVYSLTYSDLHRPLVSRAERKGLAKSSAWENRVAAERTRIHVGRKLQPSGEMAIPIIEAVACGTPGQLDAVNVRNDGCVPGLPDDMIVEVPADADSGGVHPHRMEPLPEGIIGLMRPYASIHKLLVEAFAEKSKNKLVQAVLLDPTCRSYQSAVGLVDEMIRLQRRILPPLK